MSLFLRTVAAALFVSIITILVDNSKGKHGHKESIISQPSKYSSRVNTDLPIAWLQDVKTQIKKREYSIKPLLKQYAAFNRKSNVVFSFREDGYTVGNYDAQRQLRWQVDFQVKGITRKDGNPNTKKIKGIYHSGNLLEYRYPNHTIQYKNDESGMRQNFIVDKGLAGSGSLEVIIHTEGDLNPVQADPKRLVFSASDEPGAKLIYDEIKAWDAAGKILPAHIELRDRNTIALVVDDKEANYPIVIDPLNHAPDWTDGGQGLLFPLLDDLTAHVLYGFSVAGAGDLNADGFDDVIIGSPAYVEIINVSAGTFNPATVGAAFVYFGSATGLSLTPNEVLQPTTIAGALFGFSVSSAGDITGDGRSDIVIGAPGDRVSLTVGLGSVDVAVGKVYVYSGSTFDGNVNTSAAVFASVSLKQSDFGVLASVPANPLYGFSVSSAGDVNGDGKSDIVIGSPSYFNVSTLSLAGRVDIFHGSGSGIAVLPSTIICGNLTSGLFGYSVSSAGKVNNDSFDDIIVGTPGAINILGVGEANVFHGSAAGITATISSAANTIIRAPGLLSKTLFGYSVSAAGDVNGDGRGDVVIGEPLSLELFSGSLVAVGQAHIHYGSNAGILTAGFTTLTSPRKPSLLGSIAGNLLYGYSVSGIHDINCDGLDDVMIGEPGGTAIKLGVGALGIIGTNELSGRAYTYFGKSTTGPVNAPGWTLNQTGAASVADLLGTSVNYAGDINGNGVADFIIGSPNGVLDLSASLTGIIGNALGYITTNSSGNAFGYHGCGQPPIANNDNAATNEDTAVTFNVTTNDTDTDGTINAATVDLDPGIAGIQNSFINAQGNFSVNATGNVTFTPTINFNGTATAAYQVNDNLGLTSSTAIITVEVAAVNDAPTAVNDAPTTNEDATILFNVTTNDSDVDGTIVVSTVDLDPLIAGIQTTRTTGQGAWSVDAVGEVTFAPLLNFNGIATATYTVNDNLALTSNIATISIAIAAVNDAPVAVNDSPSTNEDTPIIFSATANDTDVDGTINSSSVDLDPLTAGIQSAFSTPQGGWSVDGLGSVTFTPVSNFNGQASTTYSVKDNLGVTSNTGTLSVTVNDINDAPVAVNDVSSTNEDAAVTFNVTLNDFDSDGSVNVATVDLDILSAGPQSVFTNAQGSWSVNVSGMVTFTPALNFTGTASASYTISDNLGLASATATMSVAVSALNDAPLAVNNNATTNEDTDILISILTNDSDVDGTINPATVDLNIVTAGIQNSFANGGGAFVVSPSGDLTFTPTLNFNGTSTVTYAVNDNNGSTSNPALVTITVSPVNDAPVLSNDGVTTTTNTVVAGDITNGGDNDPDGTALIVTTVPVSGPSNGLIIINSDGTYTYTPNAGFNGTDVITIQVCDSGLPMPAQCSNQTLTVITSAAGNVAPIAVNDSQNTNEDVPVTFNVITNDSDADGTINIATVDLNPASAGIQTTLLTAQGGYSASATGQVTYTPAPNFNGVAVSSYTVNDNSGAVSNVAIISIAVAAINDAPIAVSDSPTTSEDVPLTFSVVTNDTDVDGTIDVGTVDLNPGTAGIQITLVNSAGSFTVTATGEVTYTPFLDFSGTALATYTVNDNSGTTSAPGTISINVTPVNDAPTAVNDNPTTTEDTPVIFNVTSNDVDGDGTVNAATVDLDVTLVGIQSAFSNAQGTFSVNSSGDVTYIPVPDVNGLASTTYTLQDNSGATSNPGLISITVTAVNDAPVAVNDNVIVSEDTPVTFNVATNDTDGDGSINVATVDLDPLTAGIQNAIATVQGSFSVNAIGEVTFTPTLNFNGTASIPYTVNDNNGATSGSATIAVTATAINDAPIAGNDIATVNEDTAGMFSLSGNDSDIDGTINLATIDLDIATAGIQTTFLNSQGTFNSNAGGFVTYTPSPNFNGNASASYTVNDNDGLTSGTATITIVVVPVNDAPIAMDDNATTNENNPITFSTTGNDTDIDGTIDPASIDMDILTSGIQSSFSNLQGTFSASTNGDVMYTPTLNFNGTATTVYTVSDNSGALSNAGTITIIVNAVNDPPMAANDFISELEDTPVTLNVVANDTDTDGAINIATVDMDTTTPGIQSSKSVAQGNWSVNDFGEVTLIPISNFNGIVNSIYTVRDNFGLVSGIATISITIIPVNDAPTGVADFTTTVKNTAVVLNVVGNDTDIDGTIDPNTIDVDQALVGLQNSFTNAQGVWSVNAIGNLTFTPALDFIGLASISYTVMDNEGLVSNVTAIKIDVKIANRIPVANTDNNSVKEDTQLIASGNLLSNDTDEDSDALIVLSVNNMATGTITLAYGNLATSTAGAYVYTLNNTLPVVQRLGAGQSLVENISYAVSDGKGGSASGNLVITILGKADADLKALGEVSEGPYYAGEEILMKVTIENLGVDNATGVVAQNILPSTVSFQFKSASAGELDPISKDWKIGNLLAGSKAELQYNIIADEPGRIRSAVRVKGNEDDPSPDNNESVLEFDAEEFRLIIPVGFSPNGDGVDDAWVIKNIERYPNNSIKIFNRWGNEVFATAEYKFENSWKGESHGPFSLGSSHAPNGTYFYVLSLGKGEKPLGGYVVINR